MHYVRKQVNRVTFLRINQNRVKRSQILFHFRTLDVVDLIKHRKIKNLRVSFGGVSPGFGATQIMAELGSKSNLTEVQS